MYFKFFKPQDRWKRFVVLRRGLIQSFHSYAADRVLLRMAFDRKQSI